MIVRVAGSGLMGALALSSMDRAALPGSYFNRFIKWRRR